MPITAAEISELDIQLWVDTSGSMARNASVGTSTRHHVAQELALGLATFFAKHDDDGIGLGFFGGQKVDFEDNVTGDKIVTLFEGHQPAGSTPMVKALTRAIEVAEKSGKKSVILFVCDGEPSDGDLKDLAGVIAGMTDRVPEERINISFLQVGDDPDSTKLLQFLDDELVANGAKYDAVDTKPELEWAGMTPEAIVEAAMND